MERLARIARSSMEMLHRQIGGFGHVVLLADASGVVVDSVNAPSLIPDLRQAGVYLGSCWSEADEGTCGVGTAIAEQQAVLVHQGEHFRTPHTRLTCSASPIFSADGKLVGVLDATSLAAPDDKLSQGLILRLVDNTARAVENACIISEYGHLCTVRFGTSIDFVEVVLDGLLVVDDSGRIIAANRYAREALAFNKVDIIGTPFRSVFRPKIESLLASRRPQKVFAQTSTGEQSFFAVAKPSHSDRMGHHGIGHGIRRRAATIEHKPRNNDAALRRLAGGDAVMHQAVERALRVIDKEIPVMLLGETGTGKEVFAQAMHLASSRSSGPFVAINCGAIPETLIESELFGYVGGAFTGAARTGSKGKIAAANGGTLFLDEIGDMPAHMQTRLLRVLAERKVVPVGGDTALDVDIQVICATHRDLAKLVGAREFREDLFYRLAGLRIVLPPLRDRPDKRGLAMTILKEQAQSLSREFAEIAPDALALIEKYHWPGNIRQLASTLRTALALSDSGTIRAGDLPIDLTTPHYRGEGSVASADECMAAVAGAEIDEAKMLCDALRMNSWNVTRAAKSLRVSRATAYRMIKKFGIVSPNTADAIKTS